MTSYLPILVFTVVAILFVMVSLLVGLNGARATP